MLKAREVHIWSISREAPIPKENLILVSMNIADGNVQKHNGMLMEIF
jgi:hypothetical protein